MFALDHTRAMRPAFTVCDHEADITDAWVEETDPDNERGETCRAYFRAEPCKFTNWRHEDVRGAEYVLTGICAGGQYFDRAHAIGFLGFDAVCRIEDAETENGQ